MLETRPKIWKLNKLTINWTGYWSDAPKTIFQLIRCFITSSFVIFLVLIPECLYMYQNWDNMFTVAECFSETLNQILSLSKMMIVFYFRKELQSLVIEIEKFWIENVSDKLENDEWTKIRVYTEKQSKIMTFCYMLIYVGCATNFTLNPVIYTVVKLKMDHQNVTADLLPTPLLLGYPYDIKTNLNNFIVTHVISDIAIITSLAFLAVIDAFILSLINYVASFFQLVCTKLMKISKDLDELNGSSNEMILNELKNLVEVHGIAIDFVYRLEEILQMIMLVQYVTSTFLFCLVGFQLTKVSSLIHFFIYSVTNLVCIMEAAFNGLQNDDHRQNYSFIVGPVNQPKSWTLK